MIDKKELIADLEMNKSEMHPARNGQHPVSIEVIIDYIKGFPTVGDWIPCSERLPDETDYPEQHFRILASC